MADVEAAAYDLVETGLEGFNDRYRDNEDVTAGPPGAFVVEQHPNHPDYLICEMETSAGRLPVFVLYGTDVRQPGLPPRGVVVAKSMTSRIAVRSTSGWADRPTSSRSAVTARHRIRTRSDDCTAVSARWLQTCRRSTSTT